MYATGRCKDASQSFLTAKFEMKLEPAILKDRFVRLEPLGEAHREDLRAACAADPETWKTLYIYSMLDEHFDRAWTRLEGEMADGRTIAYAVMVDGRCQGMSTYIGIDAVNAGVEIGGTYYHPAIRGAAANPASKRLMLAHAFACGATRVQFRADAINARSRAAVLKLGATQEGILRRDRVTWTGRVRDTVFFSILADEWPAVRDGLDARLAKFA
jgi:RimJ/RimL family protein N-acetyltransferase